MLLLLWSKACEYVFHLLALQGYCKFSTEIKYLVSEQM